MRDPPTDAMPAPAPPSDRPRRVSPLGALKAFFTHHVQLRRDGGNVVVELAPRDSRLATTSIMSADDVDQRFDKLPMYVALKAQLDMAPGSRQTLRHLAAVERQLRRSGFLQLDKLSVTSLEMVLRQLEGLTVPPLSPPLAELRAQVVAAIALLRRRMLDAERGRAPPSTPVHDSGPTDLTDDRVEVSELDLSEFDAAKARKP